MIMPVDLLPSGTPEARKEFTITGRFVLISLIVFFLVVASVNAIMMTLAITTFPGADARNGYDVSQAYNREIASARRQAERGWVSETVLNRQGQDGRLVLTLNDRAGSGVSGLSLDARIKHPSDRKRDLIVALKEVAPGRYEAAVDALTEGAWEVHVEGKLNGEKVFVSDRKAVVKG